MFHPSRTLNLALAIFLIAAAGCSKSSGTAVNGHVSYNGNPVAGASLIFYPATGRSIPVVVDANGDYAAQLPTGDYSATVAVGSELPPGWKEGQPIPPPKITLPPQYTKRVVSPLKATISPGPSQTVDFILK